LRFPMGVRIASIKTASLIALLLAYMMAIFYLMER